MKHQKQNECGIQEKALLDVGFAYLAVELSDTGPVPEVSVFLKEKQSGLVMQDIVLISQAYDHRTGTPSDNAIRCLVWSDPNSEDYTQEFCIKKRESSD